MRPKGYTRLLLHHASTCGVTAQHDLWCGPTTRTPLTGRSPQRWCDEARRRQQSQGHAPCLSGAHVGRKRPCARPEADTQRPAPSPDTHAAQLRAPARRSSYCGHKSRTNVFRQGVPAAVHHPHAAPRHPSSITESPPRMRLPRWQRRASILPGGPGGGEAPRARAPATMLCVPRTQLRTPRAPRAHTRAASLRTRETPQSQTHTSRWAAGPSRPCSSVPHGGYGSQ
mmetsp:Transcript_12767/g.34162  ORF Transcript_12767/g.34162 Transcript_12767/m.34162 type:complete len:227 (-) Transcript_12767:444-1124(-)